MKENNMEFQLSDKKLKKAYRKAKLLTVFRTIVIVILVMIPLSFGFHNLNYKITYQIGTEYYAEKKKMLEITQPHAYISKIDDKIGIFRASGLYTVSKTIGHQAIELYEETSDYGLNLSVRGTAPDRIQMYEERGGHQKAEEWPVNFNRAGNLQMMVFHPDIAYKEYKNDLALLDKVSLDSLLEMTLSLDQKYKADAIPGILPDANISEVLINGYSEEEMEEYKKKAEKYYEKSTFIRESEFVRLAVSPSFRGEPVEDLSESYAKFLENLQFNFKSSFYREKFSKLYSTLKEKGQLEGDQVDIIGVIVYGLPEELEKLRTNPHIKASSAGIVTKGVVFK